MLESLPRIRRTSALAGLLAIGCLAALPTWAEVYKIVDENGRVTYTDAPPKGQAAEKVELKETNTLPRTRVTKRLSPETADEQENGAPDSYEIRITHPPENFHVNPGMRNLSVQVDLNPPLHPKHRLEITDNGAPVQGTTLENIVVRGGHTLQAQVLGADGRVISRSAPVQFFVHRPSVGQ